MLGGGGEGLQMKDTYIIVVVSFSPNKAGVESYLRS